ncbi:unnamed protein product [Parnassius apollo]|uniref:(apollo) hypothetical protein n=1 Tax=Parnassius apollo TaxID=110799 RepID=A0A8S3W2A7_PARAO|nr:unnamed protein product [Parnassius apollo]
MKMKMKMKRIRRVNYTQSLDDGDFTFRFRLNKHAFNSLLLEITSFLRVTSTRNYGVSTLHQLLLTLRLLYGVGVSKSTAGRIVRDTNHQQLPNYMINIFMFIEGMQTNSIELLDFLVCLGQLMAHISTYSLHVI